MPVHFLLHYLTASPLQWRSVADQIAQKMPQATADAGHLSGHLYGIWRSQIGRPRDELTVMTVWQDHIEGEDGMRKLVAGLPEIVGCDTHSLLPTLRPENTAPPARQGNYAFRWFETPEAHWGEFLQLCGEAWPGFEASYDSQVIGLWRTKTASCPGLIGSLLLTRRPDLSMWERSKLPQGAVEAEVRRKLSRRYDLCTSTVVATSTLLTACDRVDDARWT